jgi:hypothetical protein
MTVEQTPSNQQANTQINTDYFCKSLTVAISDISGQRISRRPHRFTKIIFKGNDKFMISELSGQN